MANSETQIRSHRDLIVWQKATHLVAAVYQVSKEFPREELYCLTSQLRRAAISVPANISEGQGRRSKKEFCQFLGNARGSLLELDTHLALALGFGYVKLEQYAVIESQIQEVGRLINGLLRALSN